MDPRVRNQVGLELRQIDVEGTVKSQRGSDGTDDLANQAVQIGVGRPLDVKVTTTDVVNSLVVDHERAVGVFESGMGSENSVVRFDNGSRDLWRRVDGEFQF